MGKSWNRTAENSDEPRGKRQKPTNREMRIRRELKAYDNRYVYRPPQTERVLNDYEER